MQLVTRPEWRNASLFAVIAMALTMIPYIVGYTQQTPQQRFSGFIIAADDSFSYIAKMRHGFDGDWNFYLFYTAEPHAAAPLIFLPYIVPGQLMRLFLDADSPRLYDTMVAVFHAMRLMFGFMLLLVMYRFIAAFITTPSLRLLTLVIAALGGGLGVLLPAFASGALPPEWYIPESFTFLVLLLLPHLALARAAMLAGFLALFSSANRRVYAVLAGGLWLVTALSVPFYLVVIYAVLGVWGLLLWAKNRAFPTDLFVRCLIAGGITLPLFAYYVWVFSANPAFAQWSGQNTLPSPPLHHYLLAYGPFLVAGAFAVRSVWRSADERATVLLAWVLVGLLLVYLPIGVQRRLAEGVIVSLSILAVMGISGVGAGDRKSAEVGEAKTPRWASIALVLTTVPTMLLLLLGSTLTVISTPPDLYVDEATVRALQWLDGNAVETERGAVIAARKQVGNRLPAYTSLRPYVGHGPETLNSIEKEQQADSFFDAEWLPETQRGWLSAPDNYIDYVLYTGGDVQTADVTQDLGEVYNADGVVIYQNTLR